MSSNTLEKIITKKTEKIEKLKKTISSESLNDLIKANKLSLDDLLDRRYKRILEIGS